MFVIVVAIFFSGGPMMCDGSLWISRCYRVCVYDCFVWKCDPPSLYCHRDKDRVTLPQHCNSLHRGGLKTTVKGLQTRLTGKNNE
jgi:hypothetical protein